MTSFIFVRHGESQANRDEFIANYDTPLTKEGEAQARRAGRQLKDKKIIAILCSPTPRTQRTAEILQKELKQKDLPLITVDDLRERGFGHLEGHAREHPIMWYYEVDGEADVEPRGIVIARCEAVLAQIKKYATQDGTVLVVGHGVFGYHLREVAAGKRRIDQFTPPTRTPNATPETIKIVDVPMATGSKGLGWAFVALLAGAVLLIAGIYLLTHRDAPQTTEVKEQTIPISPEDYAKDPWLQGVVEKQLEGQTQPAQTDTEQVQQGVEPTQN